jgi:hypothetical protein
VSGNAPRTRCAAWAREVGVNPAGTAPKADVFVLVEHPLPWPSDVASDPCLASLEEVAISHAGAGRSVRLQAGVCDADAPTRRVVVFAADGPPFTGYTRSEGQGAPDQLAEVVASLVGSPPAAAPTTDVTDVLVCTHGSRDTCCGSLGTRLWLDLQDLDGVRIWRTSHTGGHRFAPTAITFPDGNCWAHLDSARLSGIVGCAAFDPAVQVADCAVLAERGWSWLDGARFGVQRSDHRVELCFEAPNGDRGSYGVLLDVGRRMPVPDCGGDPCAATKFQQELTVAHLRMWD